MKTESAKDLRRSERGAVSIKALLSLLSAAVLIFLAVKFTPVYVEQQQLKHDVDELARIAALRGWKEDKIAQDVKRIRTSYSLPEGSINVVSQDRRVQVVVDYKREIDLLVTTYSWEVAYTADGKEL